MRYILCFSFLLLFVSCNSKVKETEALVTEPVAMEVYTPSEMANHMNFMYSYNEELKERILKKDSLGAYDESFAEIYTATLTDPTDRDQSFETFSDIFIAKQKDIFDTESAVPVEKRYNTAINLCISCHQATCIGPIPRIKKLLIQ